jgi:plastocyanin
MRPERLGVSLAVLVALAACGGGGGSDGPGDAGPTPDPAASPAPSPVSGGPTLTIQNMAFSPRILEVAPGATVTVRNLDAMAHSATSQAAPNAFTRGAVAGVSFDTGAFVGTTTFAVPASAALGTVVPFYCSTHGATMVTPNGELRIVTAPATSAETPPDPGVPQY